MQNISSQLLKMGPVGQSWPGGGVVWFGPPDVSSEK